MTKQEAFDLVAPDIVRAVVAYYEAGDTAEYFVQDLVSNAQLAGFDSSIIDKTLAEIANVHEIDATG